MWGRWPAPCPRVRSWGRGGNSGVILSQIWRGLARSLEGKASFSAIDMAAALKEGADTAYKGVMKPVEGTILTVIRAGAEEAGDAARKSSDLRFLLGAGPGAV